jgi:hypothetical protein
MHLDRVTYLRSLFVALYSIQIHGEIKTSSGMTCPIKLYEHLWNELGVHVRQSVVELDDHFETRATVRKLRDGQSLLFAIFIVSSVAHVSCHLVVSMLRVVLEENTFRVIPNTYSRVEQTIFLRAWLLEI